MCEIGNNGKIKNLNEYLFSTKMNQFGVFVIVTCSALFWGKLSLNCFGLVAGGIRAIYFIVQTWNPKLFTANVKVKVQINRYWSTLWKLRSFIWPSKDNPRVQFCFIACFVLLIAGRVLGLLVPIYGKKVVDSLSLETPEFCWEIIIIFALVAFAQRFLDIAHSFFWLRVEQNSNASIQLSFFEHLHSLSHSWHLEKKPSDPLKMADRGAEGLNSIVEHVFFSILPTIADILIGIGYLSLTFTPLMGVIMVLQVTAYLGGTVVIMEWRKSLKRRVHEADEIRDQKGKDSLLNFETVKYFANEDYEKERYAQYYSKFQTEERKLRFSGQMLDLVQSLVVNFGIMSGTLWCAWLVSQKSLTTGDYFLFVTHSSQIQSYLRYFGTYYRSMQESLISMEVMLKIFEQEPQTKNKHNSKFSGELDGSCIEFRNVSFGYTPENLILNNISFVIQQGQTFALVGPSGGGKSTIFKLLFRFYEPTSGEILIDGRNIQEINQKCLRKFLGIVPQDVILFNDTIRYNVMYGNSNANSQDIEKSMKIAQLEESISKFPDGFDTKVRERGQALSGGEKLRVSIARAVLSNSSVILLDEATASLDALTEKKVQESLETLCKNKSTIIISHKIASVTHADKILVLSKGQIVEEGTHSELLQRRTGLYTKLWEEQQTNRNNKS